METYVNVPPNHQVYQSNMVYKNPPIIVREITFIVFLMIVIMAVNSMLNGLLIVYSSLDQKELFRVAPRSHPLFLDLTPLRELKVAQTATGNTHMADTIVSFIYRRHNSLISKKESAKIVNAVINQVMSDYHGDIPISLVLALIEKESTFNTKASSYDGSSFGAMQVNYRVWKDYCNLSSPDELRNTNNGVKCGLKVLSYYLDRNKGDINRALMAYRGSIHRSTNMSYARDIRSKMSEYRKIVRNR